MNEEQGRQGRNRQTIQLVAPIKAMRLIKMRNQAYDERIIVRSPMRRIECFKAEVQKQGGFTRIIFKQKNKGQEYLDISPQVAGLLGEPSGKPDGHPFADIRSSSCINEVIKRWVLRAGIRKDIKFRSHLRCYPNPLTE